jgi:hypothetical protein
MTRGLGVLSLCSIVAAVLGLGGVARGDVPDYPAAVIALTPDHYYRLDETSPGTVTDVGASPIDGAHAGDFGATGAVVGVEGVSLPGFSGGNKAFWAHGAGAVNLGDSGLFGHAAMTVALWYKDPSPAGTGVFSDRLFQNNAAAAPLTIATSSATEGTICFATGTDSGNCRQLSPSKLWLLNNAWHHLVVVRNGDPAADAVVYVDGVDRTGLFSGAVAGVSISGNRAWIAAANVLPHEGLSNATLDEVAIWSNRALSGTEIRGLYDAAIGPAPTYSGYTAAVLDAGPVAYYRLEEDAGLVAGDAVRNWVHPDSPTTTLGVGTAGYRCGYPTSVPMFAVDGARPSDAIAGRNLAGLDAGNRAAEFFGNQDNQADMVHIGGNPAWLSEAKTYSLLFKTSSNDVAMRLVASDPTTENDFDLIMKQGKLLLINERDRGPTAATTLEYNDGLWHHVVAVRAGDLLTDLTLFVDGEQVALTDNSGDLWDAPPSGRIGARAITGGGFRGLLDEVAIWDRALSEDESRALFRSLIGIAPGDANSDGSVNSVDASILAGHWRRQGGATWEDGDFNGDLNVDDADAAILAAHWSGDEATAAAPEPSGGVSLVTVSLGVLGAWGRRRRDRMS